MSATPTYVINLERAKTRRSTSEAALKAAGFDLSQVVFYAAVDAKQLDHKAIAKQGVALFPGWKVFGSLVPYYSRQLRWGEVACSLSHHHLWQRIADEGHARALILEDDVIWQREGAAAEIERVLDVLQTKEPAWDLCYVGRGIFTGANVGPRWPKVDRVDKPFSPELVIPAFSYCTHAYAVSAAGAKKLLAQNLPKHIIPADEFLPAMYTRHPRDDVRAVFGEGDRLRAFAMEPRLARGDVQIASDVEDSGFAVALPKAKKRKSGDAPLTPGEFKERMGDRDFWLQTFPGLTIGARQPKWQNALTKAELETQAELVRVEGYGRGADAALKAPAAKLAKAAQTCVDAGISPVFLYLFDQTWALFHRHAKLLARLLGNDYRVVPDFWCWHVDPKKGEAGWAPHRDQGRHSLDEDGSPKSLQIWMPLVEANALNGCMYLLPADCDPRYGKENDMDFEFDIPSIRALPAKPGDYMYWNGAVIHWGAKSSPRGEHPRISLGVNFQRGDIAAYNTPLLDPKEKLGFELRLALVAKQLVQYRQRAPVPSELQQELLRLARPHITAMSQRW